jgi:hypothetical protein
MDLLQATQSVGHVFHASRQAPWRAQRQWIGGLLLAALGLAMVASLYLDITSQAAIAGRQIQEVSNDIITVQQTNSDLQAHLAELTSADAMEQRAAQLGYQPVDSAKLEYVLVPGFQVPAPDILVAAQTLRPSAASMPPEYSESLIAWLGRRLNGLGANP